MSNFKPWLSQLAGYPLKSLEIPVMQIF